MAFLSPVACLRFLFAFMFIRFVPLRREEQNGPPINKAAGCLGLDVVQMSSWCRSPAQHCPVDELA